jgi:hypothetical protein
MRRILLAWNGKSAAHNSTIECSLLFRSQMWIAAQNCRVDKPRVLGRLEQNSFYAEYSKMTHFTILASSCAGVGVMISAYSWHNIIECRRHWFGSNHSQQSLRFAKPILSFCGLCIYEDDCNVRLPHCNNLLTICSP